jgi:hypothetical protein
MRRRTVVYTFHFVANGFDDYSNNDSNNNDVNSDSNNDGNNNNDSDRLTSSVPGRK